MLKLIFIITIAVFSYPSFSLTIKKNHNIKASNIIADFIEYNDVTKLIYAKGNIDIFINNYHLTADNLLYDLENDILWAEGNVKVKDDKNRIILGKKLVLKDNFKVGIISNFMLLFNNDSILVAKLAERIDQNKTRLYSAEFTPCQIFCNKNPIWQISSKDTLVDFEQNNIAYKHVFFKLFGAPIFYSPFFKHPTPSAPASSGILVPDIKNAGLGIPLYLRAKPNLDFTLTPRFFKKYQTFELEGRYRPNAIDNITFQGSYGNLPYLIEENGKIVKNEKVDSYHFLTNGNFSNKEYVYGFVIERTSDKAYLKNYYNSSPAYLASKLFVNKISKANYFVIEGMAFQGLEANDSKYTDPFILPRIVTKNIVNLNDSDNTSIVMENNSLIYKERQGKQLTRTSLQLSLLHNILTSAGQIFDFTLKDRGDFYVIKHTYLNKKKEPLSLARNIPEFQTTWRYPLAGNIKNLTVLIEPIISYTIGRKLTKKDYKFVIIDPDKYELSEKNIFAINRYSGIDCHDFGNRLNYGINTTMSNISKHINYLNIFLGQAKNTRYSNDQFTRHTENVGKVSANFLQNLELYYSFRKDKNFKPIRDELGGILNQGKINITAGFIQLINLKKYYSIPNIQLTNNKVKQFYGNFNYNLTDNWSIGFEGRVDVSTKKTQLLTRTIKVTYAKDCVKIAAKFDADYLVNKGIGIKKNTSLPTITIGLKVLNM